MTREMPPVMVKVLDSFAGPDKTRPFVTALNGDVGYDLYTTEAAAIRPGETKLLRTGLMIAIPEGFEAQVRPRSGNALKLGLTVLNTPGTIDPPYRGELGVICYNANPVLTVDELSKAFMGVSFDVTVRDIYLHWGQKIAQLVFNKIEHPKFEVVSVLPESVRGDAGFGSTN